MSDTTTGRIPGVGESGSGVEKAIRFAVYLTGGLITLAIGVSEFAATFGEVLNCENKTAFCAGGFSTAELDNIVPVMGAGLFFVVVAIVLLLLAYRLRGTS
jgi:hypothetical protein